MNGKTVSDLAAGPACPPAVTQPFLWSYLGFLPKPGPFPPGDFTIYFCTGHIRGSFSPRQQLFRPKKAVSGRFFADSAFVGLSPARGRRGRGVSPGHAGSRVYAGFSAARWTFRLENDPGGGAETTLALVPPPIGGRMARRLDPNVVVWPGDRRAGITAGFEAAPFSAELLELC